MAAVAVRQSEAAGIQPGAGVGGSRGRDRTDHAGGRAAASPSGAAVRARKPRPSVVTGVELGDASEAHVGMARLVHGLS